jgi:hypothetical protein
MESSSGWRLQLRSAVYSRILAGCLVLTGSGCWAVWGPIIGVGATGGATVVATEMRSASPAAQPSATLPPEQTDGIQAVPASSAQVASAEPPAPQGLTATPAPAPAVAVPVHHSATIASGTKPHRPRRRHARSVYVSSRSSRKEHAKLVTLIRRVRRHQAALRLIAKAVCTASGVPRDLPPTSIVEDP